MDGKTVSIPAPHGAVDAYLTIPATGAGPGLVLLPEGLAITPQVRDLADFYAEEGYVVIAPNLRSQAESPISKSSKAPRETGCEYNRQVDIDLALDDVGEAVAALRANPACTGKVAALGHCLGATLACLATNRFSLDAAAAYCPVANELNPEELKLNHRPIAIHFAAEDNLASAAERVAIKQALAGNDAAEVYVYAGAGHGFNDRFSTAFNRPAASLAHSRTISFLRRTIGPRYDLEALWEKHLEGEFVTSDVDATIATMVARPYVNHVPTMIGGSGRPELHRYYKYHFIPQVKGSAMIPVSRTIGGDRLVDEFVASFIHDKENDTILPGVAPTGKRVEVPMVAIVQFRGDKLCKEHIYWDQASVLVQLGLLDASRLPVTGVEAAARLLDESLPLNTLRANLWWKKSESRG